MLGECFERGTPNNKSDHIRYTPLSMATRNEVAFQIDFVTPGEGSVVSRKDLSLDLNSDFLNHSGGRYGGRCTTYLFFFNFRRNCFT